MEKFAKKLYNVFVNFFTQGEKTMQKKIFSVLLVALMLSMFVFAASAVDFIEIGDADGFMALMNAEDEATLNCNYKLTADIDLTGIKDQTPIGTREVPFTGIFDGNGFTVKGIDITSFLTETGLFGGTKGATIQNLTVEGSIVSTGNNVSGIVGRGVMPLTITNCVNKVNVLMMDSASKVGVGGMVGSALSEQADVALVITNCVNYGTIQSFSGGSGYCAGIVGYILSNNLENVNATIDGCVNYGKIDSFSASVAGGIVGYARFQAAGAIGTCTLTNCANFGEINGRCYNGGILGAFGNENGVNQTALVMNNLYNAGAVHGMSDDSSFSGSIAGLIRIPAIAEDGSAPITIKNVMDVANKNVSIIGNIGVVEGSMLSMQGMYTTQGSSTVYYNPTTNGGAFVQSSMVTLNSCAVAESDAAALTALVASDTSAWAMVDGVPALTYFADIIANAPAVLEALAPETTAAPETTKAPEAPETPDETKAPKETKADEDEEDDEKPTTTKKKPTAPVPPVEDEAPVGLIIGIVAAVLVVAAVVVVIIIKKKKK